MEVPMPMIQSLVLAILISLMMATGFATMIGGTPMVGRLWRSVGRFARRTLDNLLRWLWRNYHRELLGFVAGVLVTLFFLGRL
jgi:hypothetical protein